jgi:hypothetical protein
MMTLPLFYYSKSILSLIDTSIDLGKTSFSSLSDADKDDLINACIDELGEDAYSCIIEENFMKTVSHFKKFIASGNKEDSYKLASQMRTNAENYFSGNLEQLFEERLGHQEYEKCLFNGLFQYVNPLNGEIEWRKSA